MKAVEGWTYFLRKYGPIVHNSNMFGEEIQLMAKQRGIAPITFDHRLARHLLYSFDCFSSKWNSIILTRKCTPQTQKTIPAI